MADPYADMSSQDAALQNRIGDALEARCKEQAQVEIREAYLSDLKLPDHAFAVELGSGTGHVTHELLTLAKANRALGIEPSPVLVERAKKKFSSETRLSFQTGDAKATNLDEESIDLVVMHTLLCHVPEPEDALEEAFRILKPGGVLAICDGDYDTSTTQVADFDPLNQLVCFMINQNVTNLWIMRQIGAMLMNTGFELDRRRGHSYIAEGEATYYMTVLDRGADRMVETGLLQPETADALKAEARTRVSRNTFFGFMSYISQIAHKPST